jgi:hypothetical protein
MVFHGRLATDDFAGFLRTRAEKLALDLVIESLRPTSCQVVVSGQPGLIDAFEMAASLGPLNCLVLDVERLAVTEAE